MYVKPIKKPKDDELPAAHPFDVLFDETVEHHANMEPNARDKNYYRLMILASKLEHWERLVRYFNRKRDLRRGVFERFLARCPVDGARRNVMRVQGSLLLKGKGGDERSRKRRDAGWHLYIEGCESLDDWCDLLSEVVYFWEEVRHGVARAFLEKCPFEGVRSEFKDCLDERGPADNGRELGFRSHQPKFIEGARA